MANKKAIKEGLADLAYKAEKDHEIQMARSELYKASKYAIKLHDILKGISEEQGLQAWQQSYITKAADYLDAVYHDLEYEQEFSEPMEESLSDEIIKTAKSIGLDAKKRKSPEEMKKDRDEMIKRREKNRKKKSPNIPKPKHDMSSPSAYYASKKPGEYTGDSVDYSAQLANRLAENVKKRLK
jgi:hypothetical protein